MSKPSSLAATWLIPRLGQFELADPDPDAFLQAFIARTDEAPAYALALYAVSLRHKDRAEAVRGIFTSMVDLSDNAGLMNRFLGLPCRKNLHLWRTEPDIKLSGPNPRKRLRSSRV